ncbi:hypothetical protein RJT34_25984 [Clitoria ternatea]|uniref:Pentatricopeptide repeat-containing protein n=1 Tax=Clitoria ternatea TaxID=43366 RepID=A0AAN9F895_CLITE
MISTQVMARDAAHYHLDCSAHYNAQEDVARRNSTSRACSSAKNVITYGAEKALELFKKIIEQGISPNGYTYTILIDVLCKGRRLETAQDIFQNLLIEGLHLRERTYNVMIGGFCKEGLFDKALTLLFKMENDGIVEPVEEGVTGVNSVKVDISVISLDSDVTLA